MFNTVLGNLLVRLTGDSTQFEKMIAGAEAVFDRASKKLMGVGSLMTKALTLPLTAIGALSVKTSSDFDQAMAHSLVRFGSLSEAMKIHMAATARSIAKYSTSSAVDLAEAYGHMADAGMKATNAVTDLDYIQKFAFRNTLSLERATAFLTDSMAELGLKSNDPQKNLKNMIKLGDQMTATTELAGVSIEELAKSLEKHGGSAMRRFNISTEEGLALLAAFAQQGAKGGQAGQYLADLLGTRRMGTRRGVAGDAADILGRNALFAKQVEDQLKSKATTGLVNRESSAMLKNFNDQMTILWHNVQDVAIEIGRVLTPALEWLNKKAIEVTKWWHTLSETTKQWIVWIGVGVAALGPLLIGLGVLVGILTWINWTFLLGTIAMGVMAAGLLGLLDVALQVTTGINLGFADMVGNFRIGSFKIVTWLAAAWFGAAIAWETASTMIIMGWKILWSDIRDLGGVIYRYLAMIMREIVIVWHAGIKLLAQALDWWVAQISKVFGIKTFATGFATVVQVITDQATSYFNNAIDKSLTDATARHDKFYKDIQDMGSKSAKKKAEYMKEIAGLFNDDRQDNAAPKDKKYTGDGNLSIPEFAFPGKDLPDFGSPKGSSPGRESEFQSISLRRFNLSGPVASADKKEVHHVVAKGVEEKMDTLIQVTKEKNTLAILQ